MDIIQEFVNRIRKSEGLFIHKDQLLNEIKKSNKRQFAISIDQSKGLLLVAIEIKNGLKL